MKISYFLAAALLPGISVPAAAYVGDPALAPMPCAAFQRDEPQLSYAGYRQFVKDSSLSGRKFTFALDYKF